jgi:hypothetical protein
MRRCRTVKINLMNQFGIAGVADPVAYGSARKSPVFMGHLSVTPEANRVRPGTEQLR